MTWRGLSSASRKARRNSAGAAILSVDRSTFGSVEGCTLIVGLTQTASSARPSASKATCSTEMMDLFPQDPDSGGCGSIHCFCLPCQENGIVSCGAISFPGGLNAFCLLQAVDNGNVGLWKWVALSDVVEKALRTGCLVHSLTTSTLFSNAQLFCFLLDQRL